MVSEENGDGDGDEDEDEDVTFTTSCRFFEQRTSDIPNQKDVPNSSS